MKQRKRIMSWWGLWFILSIASLLCVPASTAVSSHLPEAQQAASLPADCSRPVDVTWIEKVDRIRWVAYSSPNPNPDGSYYQPTAADIYRDLLALKKANFTGLITYGSAGIMGKQFLTIAQSLGYQGIIMGIWNPRSQDELNNARNAASLSIVLGYGVGNEGLSGPRARYSSTDLCSAISDLHAGTGKPATTSEDIEAYYRQPELLNAGDWVFPISHPYWHFTKYALDAIQWEQRPVCRPACQNRALCILQRSRLADRRVLSAYRKRTRTCTTAGWPKRRCVSRTSRGSTSPRRPRPPLSRIGASSIRT